MQKNTYPGKFTPHLSIDNKNQPLRDWFISVGGKPILPRRKGAGFIVFEGLDGSGQSTQSKLLAQYLTEQGRPVVLTKEPTLDSQAGKKIREILDEKTVIEPAKLQELFVEDRREHLKNLIIPALKEGKIVISDRYFFSTLAYGAIDLDLEWLIKINDEFLLPDIILILAVKPETAIERIKNRGDEIKLFEKQEKLEKVWRTYQILSQRFSDVYMINGEKSIKDVHSDILKIIKDKFSF